MEVRIDNLSKHFPGVKGAPVVKAVDQMDFTIADGKLVGLLGPSGCGKSTTLYMIAGLHKPTEGKIWFGDRDVTEVPAENRGIGLVFQNYALYPHFTVRQNIRFPLENVRPRLPKEEMEQIVEEVANLVDIGSLLDRVPKQLSGGQQQRVAIARALSKRPQVLLLDEPLSNLDARLRLQTREEIRRIQRDTKVTTIFVTHDQEEAMSISDQIVVMRKGVVHQIDAPQVVYDEPVDLFVAKFLGSPAINIFNGYLKNGQVLLHDNVYHKGLKSKGDFDYQDLALYDIAVAGGYLGTKAEYAAAVGVEYVEEVPQEEVAEGAVAQTGEDGSETPVVGEAKPKKNVFKEFFAKLKPKPKKKYFPTVIEGELNLRSIFEELVLGGYRTPFDEFEEAVGGLIVAAGVNRDVKIGVRPEAFTLDKNENPAIEVDVLFIEHIGRDITIVGNVHGQNNKIRVIIPAEERSKVNAETIKVYPKRFYLFDLDGSRML